MRARRPGPCLPERTQALREWEQEAHLKILNETVYDTDDLEQVVLHTQRKAFERAVQNAKNYNANRATTGSGYPPTPVPTAPDPLPEQIRFGYYNNPKGEDHQPKGRQQIATVDVCYVSSRGRYWRRGDVFRIGIAPPTKLPLNAMQVIALAASDKDQRTLPNQVLVDLVVVLMRALFRGCASREEDEAWLLTGCPTVRYGFQTDRSSAKESKAVAREANLQRARQNIKWSEERLARLKESLAEEEEKLAKLKARLAKLEGREMSYVGAQ